MNFFEYQARKFKAVKRGKASESATVPVVKIEELEARPAAIEVEEISLTDTFVGRLRADLRKLWGKE